MGTTATGCSGVGIEVVPSLHAEALQICAAEILQKKLTFINAGAEDLEVCGQGIRHCGVHHSISTVFLYVYPHRLATCPKLLRLLTQLLKAGAQIMTSTWELPHEVVAVK